MKNSFDSATEEIMKPADELLEVEQTKARGKIEKKIKSNLSTGGTMLGNPTRGTGNGDEETAKEIII